MNFTMPTFHLNGSGQKNLRDEYQTALNALHAARAALVNATCNARDFYPQGDHAYYDARNERAEAFKHLHEVEDYLTAWVVHCYSKE